VTLRIAKDLVLPLDVVTQTIAILAKRRAGKSYTMRRLAEQLHWAKQQVVLIDPKGDQWGIRSSADGRGPGLPILILGGERGDAPLESGAGEVVAKLVVEERVSVLLDLSLFRKKEVAVFMTAFLEALYRLKAREANRTPVMLVIDEADAIAPQKPMPGEERMLGAAEDIVRRGGQRGIGCVLVTQRSAVLNKNVLTQAQVLVALRTIAPQDLKAMNAWIDVHGTPEQRATLMASLPSLPIGDAWFWSPGWPTVDGIFKRVHVLPIETFDSGATPVPGVKPVEPKNLADVDVDALKRQMAATIEKAKAEDPRILRQRVAELERHLKASEARTVAPAPPPAPIEVPVLTPATLQELEGIAEQTVAAINEVNRIRTELGQVWTLVKESLESARILSVRVSRPTAIPVSTSAPPVTPRRTMPADRNIRISKSANSAPLGAGERRILIAIAQHPAGVTREQLTVLTGYKRSSRDTYLQRLGSQGLILVTPEAILATDAGVDALGSAFELLPTGDELRRHWLGRLTGGERTHPRGGLLRVPERGRPGTLSRRNRATSAPAATPYIQRLAQRKLVHVVGRGELRASEELFG